MADGTPPADRRAPDAGSGGGDGGAGRAGGEGGADGDDWRLLARDLLVAFAIVAGIVLVIFAFTGTWPPVVVVESGSMMHDDATFGRVGTIDPGDLIFVRTVDSRTDVLPFKEAENAGGGHRTYGAPGDVIIFQAARSTPIIHRAMAWVELDRGGGDGPRYTVAAYGVHAEPSISIPELGLNNYRPNQGGFLTKGDSRQNRLSDQAVGIVEEPVAPRQILGKARGEVPWFGLIKLMFSQNTCERGWLRIGRACAPTDLWAMLGVGMAGVLAIPLVVDYGAVRLEERGIDPWTWLRRRLRRTLGRRLGWGGRGPPDGPGGADGGVDGGAEGAAGSGEADGPADGSNDGPAEDPADGPDAKEPP